MYNPSDPGKKGTIFGLPYSMEESDLIFLPVHLDTTVSYSDGTAKAPSLILSESTQLDLSLVSIDRPWTLKMAMHPKIISKSQNEIHRGRAKNVIKAFEAGKKIDQQEVNFINDFCETTKNEIEILSGSLLDLGKIVAVVGGDHSSPLGLINALASRHEFAILQIDAHMDLRKAYEGFQYSHASIMHNALNNQSISHLTQVGIRDFCEEEMRFAHENEDRISVYFDDIIYQNKLSGTNWKTQCEVILATLPEKVYVSFDVDGLDPSLCPNSGTPVPGGINYHEATYLLEQVARSGRQIIGFDVCETGYHSWDANVSSRILYRLAAYTGVSNGLLSFN